VESPYAQDLLIECPHPSRSVDRALLETTVRHVVDAEGGSLVHLSLVLSDHDTVRSLNREYLGHDYNTDVLAFSLQDGSSAPGTVEGEVYVDLDTAAERHDEFDDSFRREACRYVVHGVLHLLGYSDKSEQGQDRMRALEDQYLDAIPVNGSPPQA